MSELPTPAGAAPRDEARDRLLDIESDACRYTAGDVPIPVADFWWMCAEIRRLAAAPRADTEGPMEEFDMELHLVAFEKLLPPDTPMRDTHRIAFRAGWTAARAPGREPT